MFYIVAENVRIYILGNIFFIIRTFVGSFFRIFAFLSSILFRSRSFFCLGLVFFVDAFLDLLQRILHLLDIIALLGDLLKQGHNGVHFV